MKQIITILIFLSFFNSGYCQWYEINHFQDVSYDTLNNYNSIVREKADSSLIDASISWMNWDNVFDLGFIFPFYGQNYSTLNIDHEFSVDFPFPNNASIFLFSGDYIIGNVVLDTSYFEQHDVRYATTIKDNKKVFILEYYNNYIGREFFKGRTNHHVNFQTLFYETGLIEVRFGDIDLDSCTYYIPDYGQSFTDDGDTTEIFGPWVTISDGNHTDDYCFMNSHQNPTLFNGDEDWCGVLTSIPPEGYVIQFVPQFDVSLAPQIENPNNYKVIFNSNKIDVVGAAKEYVSCSVYDMLGKEIAFSKIMNFQLLIKKSQIVFVVIKTTKGVETHKIFITP